MTAPAQRGRATASSTRVGVAPMNAPLAVHVGPRLVCVRDMPATRRAGLVGGDVALARSLAAHATAGAAQAGLHPAVDERRPQPDGYLRSQAGPRERRIRSRRSPPACPASRSRSTCPRSPAMAEHLAIIRSMSTKEGDHGRATYLLRNGYLPQPPVRYPTLGSLVAKELGDPMAELPNFVSIAPYRNLNPAAFGPGFLGSQYAAAVRRRGTARRRRRGHDGGNYGLTVADLAARRRHLGRDGRRAAGHPELAQRSLHRRSSRRAGRGLQDRLRSGRAADAQRSGQGVRSGRRARRRARRLRPQPLRPGLPARPAAGRAGRAVRRGDARRRQRAGLGHARRTTSTRSRSSAARSTRPGPR